MANTAENLETALFWRRFSAIGWTSVYSFMVHFLLLLAKGRASLRDKRIFGFIYIPALIYIPAFKIGRASCRERV